MSHFLSVMSPEILSKKTSSRIPTTFAVLSAVEGRGGRSESRKSVVGSHLSDGRWSIRQVSKLVSSSSTTPFPPQRMRHRTAHREQLHKKQNNGNKSNGTMECKRRDKVKNIIKLKRMRCKEKGAQESSIFFLFTLFSTSCSHSHTPFLLPLFSLKWWS